MAHPADRTHYAKVTTQATSVNADLTDYPMSWDLSLITDQTWWNNIKSDGGDLMVYTEAGDRVAVAMDNPDTVAKTGWVHWLSSPSASVNQQWRIWVGNSSASQPAEDAAYGSEAVWNSAYLVRMSLGETVNNDAGGYIDSTSNDNDGTGSSMASAASAGQIASAQNFDGSADHISLGNVANITADMTVQCWIKTSGTPTSDMIASKKANAGAGWYMWVSGTGKLNVRVEDGTDIADAASTASINDNALHSVAGVLSTNTVTCYIDGAQDGTNTSGSTVDSLSNANALKIADSDHTTDYHFAGQIDEFRLSDVARSSDWLSTEYNNQSGPGAFNVYGGVFSSHRNRIMCAA